MAALLALATIAALNIPLGGERAGAVVDPNLTVCPKAETDATTTTTSTTSTSTTSTTVPPSSTTTTVPPQPGSGQRGAAFFDGTASEGELEIPDEIFWNTERDDGNDEVSFTPDTVVQATYRYGDPTKDISACVIVEFAGGPYAANSALGVVMEAPISESSFDLGTEYSGAVKEATFAAPGLDLAVQTFDGKSLACPTSVDGKFTIDALTVAPGAPGDVVAITGLSARWSHQCQSEDTANVGQVKLGADIAIPGRDVFHRARAVIREGSAPAVAPVRIGAVGTAALAVSSATIEGGNGQFAKVGDTCTGVSVGPGFPLNSFRPFIECSILVQYTPTTPGVDGTAELVIVDNTVQAAYGQKRRLDLIGISKDVLPAPGAPPAGLVAADNFVVVDGTPRTGTPNPIYSGPVDVLEDSLESFTGDSDDIVASATNDFTLTLKVPQADEFAVGRYPGGVLAETDGDLLQPFVDLTMNGQGTCATVNGSFTVHSIDFDGKLKWDEVGVDGRPLIEDNGHQRITRMAADFRHQCNGTGDIVSGSIRFNSGIPWNASEAAPSTVQTGPVELGGVVTQPVTVKALGTASTTFGAAKLIDSDVRPGAPTPSVPNNQWVIVDDDCNGVTLNPVDSSTTNDTCVVTVRYTAGSTGLDNAILTIPANTPAGSRDVPLVAQGQATPKLKVATSPIDFGATAVGDVSGSATVVISNVGIGGMALNTPTLSGPFGGSTDCGTAVPPNSSCSVRVFFKPTARGSASGSLNITSAGGNATVPLTGKGVLGYIIATNDGKAYGFGDSVPFGVPPSAVSRPIVSAVSSATAKGQYFVDGGGGVFATGDAPFFGSTGNLTLNQPVVGIAVTPTGKGYWLVARDGGIFAFGDAGFFGSTGNIKLNQPIVGMAATPSGKGYWMVASDGGIFAFGDAAFMGSTGNIRLNQPVVGMARTGAGDGYWMVARDGGIFTFGKAVFHGSTGNIRLNQPIVGMTALPQGTGYWMLARDGGIFSFGSAIFLGGGAGVIGDTAVALLDVTTSKGLLN